MILSDLSLLQTEVTKLKAKNKRIVWTNGCFDMLHPGHIETFAACRALGDVVVVGLNGDRSPYWKEKPGRPINSEATRACMLEALRNIDIVYIYNEETPILPIQAILPDVLVKGGDYETTAIVGYTEVREAGGTVLTIPLVGDFSTSNLITKILQTYT